MAKNKDNREKTKKSNKLVSMVENTSNKVENQNQTHNSKKEGLGPNGKR